MITTQRAILTLVPIMFIGVIACPETGQAQPKTLTTEQKQKLIDLLSQGRQAYQRGQFKQALALYERAYKLFQDPSILRKKAQCLERLNRIPEAISTYQLVLNTQQDETKRQQTRQIIDLLKKRLPKKQPNWIRIETTPSGATVKHQQTVIGQTPFVLQGKALPTQPTALTITLPGYHATTLNIETKPNETQTLRIHLLKKPVQVDKQPSTLKYVAWISAGTLAAVSITAFGVYLHAENQLDSFDSTKRQPNSMRPTEYDVLVDRSNTSQIIGWSSATLAVTGLLLGLLSP